MQGNAPKSPITGVPGWMTDAEEALLIRYVQKLHAGNVIVNIGCEYGRSLIALAKAAPETKVYGVELAPKEELNANLNEAQISHDVVVLIADSKVVGNEWDNEEKVALLFVDGAHEYENVVGDIEAWYPHIASNGYIIFHDVAQDTNPMPHYLHKEVTRAIAHALPPYFKHIESVDSIAVYQSESHDGLREFAKNSEAAFEMAKPETDGSPVKEVEKPKSRPGRKAKSAK